MELPCDAGGTVFHFQPFINRLMKKYEIQQYMLNCVERTSTFFKLG